MTWEYLNNSLFEIRFKIVGIYLRDKTKGKHIVDLNCGNAKLLDYIEHNYKSYLANDTNNDYLEKKIKKSNYNNITFIKQTDEQVRNKIAGIDIFVVFGHGAGEYTNSNNDSKTLTDTIRYLKIVDDNDGSATELYPGCDIDAVTHPREPVSVPGDVNADYLVNLSDVIYLANHLMKSGPAPTPFEAGDVNCDCEVDLGDVIYLANYLLKSGTPPAPLQECECEYRF